MIGMYAFAYPNMIVEHYTAERGLPNNIVNCTLKGQDGFIWFGTGMDYAALTEVNSVPTITMTAFIPQIFRRVKFSVS